jgi:CheY-like chemotaxis protein
MSTRTILMVDDDPDIIEYLTSFLEDEGYRVSSAQSSSSALALLEGGQIRPDTILIDVLMPGRSGLDLLVKLRRHAEWQNTPVVVVTGHDRILEDDCASYLGSFEGIRGPDGILGKPVDREALLAVLKTLNGNSGQPT